MKFKDKYRIIIKFTENDNIAAPDHKHGWVDYFSKLLRQSLSYQIDGDIEMIHKSELDLITKEDFNNSDLILYILSPAFIFSSNINQDAEKLETAFNFDIPYINNKVKKVFKAPVKVEDLPLSISTPTYYRFYDFREKKENEYTTFEGWNTYQENIEFWTVFTDVFNDALKLFSLEKEENKKKIYISNKSKNYFHFRNMIKRELNTFQIEIFPDEDFSIEANYMEDPESFFMQKCDISLHFPDEFLTLNTEERTKAFKKLEDNKRYIWFNPTESLEPEKRAAYNDLKIQLKPFQNIEAIETPLEELKEILKTTLFKKELESENISDDREIVYILSDTYISEEIKADLQSKDNIQSKFNLKILSNVENVADYRSMHYELLKNAHRFLIVYLKGNTEWLNTMVSEVKKAPGFEREHLIAGKYLITSQDAIANNDTIDKGFKITYIDSVKELLEKFSDTIN